MCSFFYNNANDVATYTATAVRASTFKYNIFGINTLRISVIAHCSVFIYVHVWQYPISPNTQYHLIKSIRLSCGFLPTHRRCVEPGVVQTICILLPRKIFHSIGQMLVIFNVNIQTCIYLLQKFKRASTNSWYIYVLFFILI